MSDDLSQKYLDFDLEIGPGQGREYPVVVHSPGGDARTIMHFPFDDLALENRLLTLKLALKTSSGKRRQAPLSKEEEQVQAFGASLAQALLTGEVRTRYELSLQQASKAKGLRIRLRILDPGLAVLPWEYLYDPQRGSFISLSERTPIVRCPESPLPVESLEVQAPLRILAMIASPKDPAFDELDVEDEKRRLENALEDLRQRGLVELHWLEGQTWKDLKRALRNGEWNIFHFIGHGGFDERADQGLLVLCRENGSAYPVLASNLTMLLSDSPRLRLVVLNACEAGRTGGRDIFSSAASILVRSGLPAALAMQYPITDRGAIEFSQAFYEALADGLEVDAAVSGGRQAIRMEMPLSLEWGVPVLYTRAKHGRMFNIQKTGAAGSAGQQPLSTAKQTGSSPIVPTQRTSARDDEETLTLAPGVTMTFVRVPAGPFLMGTSEVQAKKLFDEKISEERWLKDEEPQHSVNLSFYWMAKTPVTVAQFEAFIKSGNYRTTAEREGKGWDWTGSKWEEVKGADWRHPRGPNSDVRQKANHPVTQVSWEDAGAFCEWASKVTGKQIHLPSEAEWEKAARGEKGWLYPWGDDPPDEQRANFNMNIGDTTPVGQYSPQGDSPYDCIDMAGNVWEWCADWYSDAEYSRRAKGPVRDPAGPPNGDYRVLHGGAWNNDVGALQCAYRGRSDPSDRSSSRGFRPARSP